MTDYQLKVVNRSGTPLATFDGNGREEATVDAVTWALNEPGSCTFRVPAKHAAAGDVWALRREVQVWRDASCIFWGVPLQRRRVGGAVEWTCPGLLWYLSRRRFGPISTNYLTNPRFETNLAGWTAVGCTATRVTAPRVRGPGSARLVATTSSDNYLQQTVTIASTGGVGLFLTFRGWYWIDPAVTFTAPAFDDRGIFMHRVGQPAGEAVWDSITMDSPRGIPTPINVGIHLPANLTNVQLDCRLAAPHAAIQWGALSITALESVSSEPTGTDVTEMLRRMFAYATGASKGLSLNIGTSTPAAGVTEVTAYQFAELAEVLAAMKTYPERGLADYAIVHNLAGTTRTFTTFSPTRGTLRSDRALRVPGPRGDLHDFQSDLDGQQTATRVIRRYSGDTGDAGSGVEYGEAVNSSLLDGLILEDVDDAPPEVPIDGLDSVAFTDLGQLADIVHLPRVTVPAAGWVGSGGVDVGDRVPVEIDWGAIQHDTDRRINRMTLHPVRDEVDVELAVIP